MTTIDRTTATDAEFAERIAGFKTASMPPEVLREMVAQAICDAAYFYEPASVWSRVGPTFQDDYRRLADAALAVVAQQPHPVVQRVEAALAAQQEWVDTELVTDSGFAEQCAQSFIDDIRAALAGDPQ